MGLTPRRVEAFGPDAVLADVESALEVRELDRTLRERSYPGIDEIVPAARSVLVVFDPAVTSQTQVREWVSRATIGSSAHEGYGDGDPAVELRVRYDGVDLASLAEAAGLTVRDVIARHTSAELTVAFCGFAPGFAYLEGFDIGFDIPRLASPRQIVPAGSVAAAARYTAVYPRALPGGWQLMGTCLDPVFDADATPPTQLAPGRRVRFVEAK